ncbi:copper radical oxidase, partial [Laetiporus sulphureus 93-53]
MQQQRWYSAAEPLANGTIAIIDCFHGEATVMNFMIKTSGLNSYAHAYMMASGRMFLRANISTILWEPDTNTQYDLPDMPDNLARVHPASGATAMMPLTIANDYTPSVLFCGGTDMDDYAWGNYSPPFINTFYYPASARCHYITSE